ncbi:MAG TPA: DsbA family protein [Acidocella sp.]|jgi:protein-disulfide isomerase|uniref:DsbA family protein n=1 Tax=Acidocella sp. TaxID=50710 RepID=UPI002B78719A|nr:DsbA family protein [Acidocella sp.]HVE22672.1 DsbA family protein [Acidocella sp.]
MRLFRRSVLSLVGASVIAPSAFAAASSSSSATPFSERSIGSPTAPVTAIEYFSLTCTHCAEFGTVTMPQVKPNLVDTGKLRIIYRDFPLDDVALMAAQVARYLPVDQYYPFIEALFAGQNDWAFAPGVNYKQSIYKYAALAGMDQETYNAALADTKLRAFILNEQQVAEKKYNVNATPTFIINGKIMPGAMDYADFRAAVNAAS